MNSPASHSPIRALQAAPWISVACFILIAATYAYCKLYIVALFVAPLAGLAALAFQVAYWRSGKAWLSNMPFVMLLLTVLDGGPLWAVLQSLSVALLFLCFPLWLFRQPISRYVTREHS
jgi:hypothetical protein